jgi:glutamine amidotransferase
MAGSTHAFAVVVVDYGMCNLDSVARAVEECGGTAVVTSEPDDLREASHVILPGVGSFGDAMSNIRSASLDRAIREQVVDRKTPFLGICLGMQLMASTGSEGGEHPGLDLVPGRVDRLQADSREARIPHVGWNEVDFVADCPLFEGVDSGSDFYFVHSYRFVCAQPQHVAATTPYCGGFTSVIQDGPLFGTQFHPEKSQGVGFKVLSNFLAT